MSALDLREQLERLERVLRSAGADAAELFRPRASEADLDLLSSVLGFDLPEDARTLFTWHDGTRLPAPPVRPGSGTLGATGLEFMPQQEAFGTYHKVLQELERPFLNDERARWHPRWFPLLAGGPMAYVWISCLEPTSQEILLGDSASGRGYRVEDLATVIAEHARLIEDGTWVWARHPHFGWDDRRWPQADTQAEPCRDLRERIGTEIEWGAPMHPTS